MFHHKINTVKVQMFPYASANNDKIFQKKKNLKSAVFELWQESGASKKYIIIVFNCIIFQK